MICICGGGSLGHVVAAWLSARAKTEVNILTGHPSRWQTTITIDLPNGNSLAGPIARISGNPADVVPQADVVLLCVPGFLIVDELRKIAPYLKSDAYVGCVFSSTGFFFKAMQMLPPSQPLWGFQRVPFICRVAQYGQSAHLLGFKEQLHIAVEHVSKAEKQQFARQMEDWFECPVSLLANFYEASLTNSNPLLHTARLYTLFGGKNEGRTYPRMIRFYEEWTMEASLQLIRMDAEFFRLLDKLPVRPGFLPTILGYYESHDARSLTLKLSSIQGFKGITSPMRETARGWEPDFSNRYFTEDFPHGLHYIWQLAHDHSVDTPEIDKVYQWGMSKIGHPKATKE